MSPVRPAPDRGAGTGFTSLLARYLSFFWLLEDEPADADPLTRALIRRRNRALGRRHLPRYLARYLGWLLVTAAAGFCVEAISAPALIVGACFILSALAAIAALIAGIGLAQAHRHDAHAAGLPAGTGSLPIIRQPPSHRVRVPESSPRRSARPGSRP